MSDIARRPASSPDFTDPSNDERSSVRSRGDAERTESRRPGQDTPGTRGENSAKTTSARPPSGSLDSRIEQKVRLASTLIRDLPATDARVRLLHIAVMRRDESLLDGVLSELNKPAREI